MTASAQNDSGARQMLFRAVSWIGSLMLATFPLWTYWSLETYGVTDSVISSVAIVLISGAFFRILWKPVALTGIITMATAILAIVIAITHSLTVLKFWPVLVCALVILALIIGMGKPDGMVAQSVAATSGGKTDAPVMAYSKALSFIWIVVFLAIGALAVLTCFWGNMKSWMFWNGIIAWAIGLLFWGTERLARNFFLTDLRKQAAMKGLR